MATDGSLVERALAGGTSQRVGRYRFRDPISPLGGSSPPRPDPCNHYLRGALGIAALSAARSKNTYYGAKYKRIAARRGPMPAIVAVEHAMIIAAWNLLTNGDLYCDPGADYYTRRLPAKTKACAIGQLEPLDTVSLWSHSPRPRNPPPSRVARCGHPNSRVSRTARSAGAGVRLTRLLSGRGVIAAYAKFRSQCRQRFLPAGAHLSFPAPTGGRANPHRRRAPCHPAT